MPEDFFNGLSVVPLYADNAVFRSITVSAEHPWRDLFREREPPDMWSKTPSFKSAPLRYVRESQLQGPRTNNEAASSCLHDDEEECNCGEVELHEMITLSDVEAFRNRTVEKVRALANDDQTDLLSGGLDRLSTSSSPPIAPVIYRYIDVIKNPMALLEAIHFELFMPDRPDLRFLAVPFSDVPSGTLEGDFFLVSDAHLLSEPSYAVKLDIDEFPVMWEAKGIEKIDISSENEMEGLAYVVNKKARDGGESAITEVSDRDIFIREQLFPDADSRSEHSLVRVTMKRSHTAHLYPVEPPTLPDPPTMRQILKELYSMSSNQRLVLYRKINQGPLLHDDESILMYLEENVDDERMIEEIIDLKLREIYSPMIRKLKDHSMRGRDTEEDPAFDPRSEYLKRVCGTCPSSQRSGHIVFAVRALTDSEAERIEDRLGEFTTYGQPGDLELMDELFRLGSRYRVNGSTGSGSETKDMGEMKVDESVIHTTICDKIGRLEECRPLLDCIYGRRGAVQSIPTVDRDDMTQFANVSGLVLNEQQSRAVRAYVDPDGPRVFCILSPPGSGKTTVAAAMAAEVGRVTREVRRSRQWRTLLQEIGGDGVQLLLSVQNVAVDNMGAALKKMNYGGGTVYNMKSSKKLDPHNPAPYDYFDLMNEEELDEWRKGKVPMYNKLEGRRFKSTNESLTHNRREYEKTVNPKILLSTVEMVLQKLYTPSKLCSDLRDVTRVIIDEASLLTEAALFCIIRRFPMARIVLIGDDRQLSPFMYDNKILGQELAGRPALIVAMKTGRVPVVELNEVYRAPPSLVAPYNRLAYGGRLVSKKAEGESPLSVIGLVHSECPQLLLIDVDGREEKNEDTMSLSNAMELEVLMRLLRKFPRDWTKEIMIICLYNDQKKRLQEMLDTHYQLNPTPNNQYTVLTGKEKPIVIVMTTRTQRATDFFCSSERCNVAVSRQQKALIILGKAPLLTTNKPWSTVVNGDDFTTIRAENIK